MKVVINSDFGGFGLSSKAMKMLIERKAKGVKVKTEDEYTGDRGREHPVLDRFKDAGDGYEVTRMIEDVLWRDGNVYMWDDDNRTDPDLIEVVESLGREASGRLASLNVVEIPDDVEWEIEEYDGSEWVAEKHRTWA